MMNKNSIVSQELLESLRLTQGDHINLLTFLIKSEDDLNEFMHKFYDSDGIRSLVRFQQHKREINKLSFEEFDVLFHENKKSAIEVLFQEPIQSHQVDYLEEYNLSHEELYKRYQNNANTSYLMLVKGNAEEPLKDLNDDFLLEY